MWDRPRSHAPSTVYAFGVRHAVSTAHPSNERCLHGTFPLAYAYPKGMRETRDLLRRRTYLVRTRAELLTHLQLLNAQYNLAPFPKKLSFAANRAEMNIAARFTDPRVQKSATVNLALIDRLEELWRQEDRQRPPALGLRRAGVSAFAR